CRRQDEDRTRAIPLQFLKSGANLEQVPSLNHDKGNAQGARGGLNLGNRACVECFLRVPNKRDTAECWDNLLEKLQLLCSEIECKRRGTRDVASGVRQARDKTAANGITYNRHHYRN